MKSNCRKLGELITQRREKNPGGNLPIRGVSQNGFIPPKQQDADTGIYNVFYRGDFVYNPARMELGSIAFNDELDKAICSSLYEIFYVHRTDLVLPEYLALFVSRSEFARNCEYLGCGSAREYCRFVHISEIEICLPSLEEQRRTVRMFSSIKQRLKILMQLNDKLAAMMNGLYESHILSRTSSNLPSNWKKAKLGQLCEKIGSGATPRGGKTSYLGGETSLIRSMNVFDYNFSYANLAHIADAQAGKLDNVAVKPYDVLLNITGVSVARCCIVPEDILPARVNQHVMILRAYDQTPRMNFLIMCSLCNQFYKQQLLGISQSGSTREAINKGEMEEFEIVVPDDLVLSQFGQSAQALYQMMQASLREMNMLGKAKELLLGHLA